MKSSIWYDRTIPEEFQRELSAGGRFERLVRFAHRRHLADVQLRATGSLSWATIYCGLTNVLHTNEGAVQAMLCANGGESYQVIDREAVFGFRDTAERERIHRALKTPLLAALDVPRQRAGGGRPPSWVGNWTSSPSMPGGGCWSWRSRRRTL